MISLNGEWIMRRCGDAELLQAVVPGTVYTDLLRNEKMPDPFVGENEDAVMALSVYDYEYEKEFYISENEINESGINVDSVNEDGVNEDGANEGSIKRVLVCEGLDTIADVYINDRLLAKTQNMHRTYRFDLADYLCAGRNVIKIHFHSPLKYIEEKDNLRKLWGVTSTVPGYQHIRKAHCMFGWDWGPKLPDMGIFRDIYIEETKYGRIAECFVRQTIADNRAQLEVSVDSELNTNSSDLILECVLISPDGEEIFCCSSAAKSRNNIHIDINDVKLWWPNGYGQQPLYELKIFLKKNGIIFNEKIEKIGLRTISVCRKEDEWGEKFEFHINGISVFAKGANYIPQDSLIGRCSKERTQKLIKSCVDANFNCIRVWGGGYYPDDYFYDICDELGLIVWQDFMFACAVYDLTDEFESNIKAEFKDNICRIRNHACLGMWCGNNEMEMAWDYWGIPQNQKLRSDYINMFERILPKMVNEYSPDTFYWPASPSSGGGFVDCVAENKGDMHYWDVWHGKKPFEDLEDKYFRFASEYGFQSVPCIKTLEKVIDKDEFNMFSPQMESHQKCIDNGHGNVTLMYYLFQYYRYPKDFKSIIYTSQVLQADCLETAIAHFRSNRGRCMGSTYWQLNDCWPVVSWSTIDYYGRYKAAHYIVKRRYAQIVVSVEIKNNTASFYVSSEEKNSVNAEFFVNLVHQIKGKIYSKTLDIEVGELSACKVMELPLEKLLDKEERDCYINYGIRVNGDIADERFKLLVKPKYFNFKDPKISLDVKETGDRFIISLSTEQFARRVGIEFINIDAVLSDNYFDMPKGGKKEVYILKKDLNSDITCDILKQETDIMSNFDIAN